MQSQSVYGNHLKSLFELDKKIYSYAKNLPHAINNKIDRIGENTILKFYQLANNPGSANEKGFWGRNKKLIGYSLAIAAPVALAAYAIAGYVAQYPPFGYSIDYISKIGTQSYKLVPNPVLHPGLVLTKGFEIFSSNPAQLEGMVRDSAIEHTPLYFAGSSIFNFLIGKAIGKSKK